MPPLTIWWDFSNSSGQTVSGGFVTAQANVGVGGTATLLGPAGSSTAGFDPPIANLPEVIWEDGNCVARVNGTNTVYPRGSSSFAVSTVFNTTQNFGFVTFANQGRTSGSTAGWIFGGSHTVPGTYGLFMRDTSLASVNCTAVDTGLYDGEFHTITAVRDNDEELVSLYFDGVLVNTTALAGSFGVIDKTYDSPWDDFMIGARPAGGTTIYQNGSSFALGELLIYNSPLTQEQVTLLHDYHIAKWS